MAIKGRSRLDRRTKNLVQRLKKNDIAIIDHDDIDEVAAHAKGALKILKAGIPILDQVGEDVFSKVKEGVLLEIRENKMFWGNRLVAEGEWLTLEDVQGKLKEANVNSLIELENFVENTLEYAQKEKDILLGNLEVPQLKINILNRHVLIVVRGSSYKEDLRTISAYIQEEQPVLIGVDGGADALLEFGDMDSVSDEALKSGAEVIVHAYADKRAPGLERIEAMGIEAGIFPMPGTSEDMAMMLAWEYGASLIVAVGTHSNMVDFMEKGRQGMGSTFLVRLKVGSILVDARGVSQLYKQNQQTKYLFQLLLAALIPIIMILAISPATKPLFRLLTLQLKLLFNF